MVVIRKYPALKFVCRTFGWRYNNWYKRELEEEQKLLHATVEIPEGYQYELPFLEEQNGQ